MPGRGVTTAVTPASSHLRCCVFFRSQHRVEQAREADLDVVTPERVEAASPFEARGDEPGFSHHLEVMAARRLRNRQAELGALHFAVRPVEDLHQLYPDRITQRLQHVDELDLVTL